ncbi:MAG: hypothetical protein WA418_30330 [Bradyrhizobium sp.]
MVDIDPLKASLPHTQESTTVRCIRRRSNKIKAPAEARKQSRTSGGSDGEV